MATSIKNFETISDFNQMLGVDTLHPLVSVICLDNSKPMHHLRHTMSFYAIFLKDEKNCDIVYGRKHYDYDQGSVVCLAPGQVIGIEDTGEIFQPKGWALFFDPQLIHGTQLGQNIHSYHFFTYEVNEALHLSNDERQTFILCLQQIRQELQNNVDHLSKRLISSYIEILLNYCQRFYERQFNTRREANSDVLMRFEQLLNKYFEGNNAMINGLPTVNYCASKLFLSANYFGDLIKKETGKTPRDYITAKILQTIKSRLAHTDKSITQIADELGFQYPQHLSKFFKKETGYSPINYRKQILNT